MLLQSLYTSWVLLALLPNEVLEAQPTQRYLAPGAVYKEFMLHNSGDRAWRVTNPHAKDSGAKKYLPNPVLELEIDDLDGAIGAEAMLDRWGGHLHTLQPTIRFNQNEWLTLPPPVKNGQLLPEDYYFQDNPVVPVPITHLKVGTNTIEGDCRHTKPDGWGQWGLYSLILRVYFDPSRKPHERGRIMSPQSGDVLPENPKIRLDLNPEKVRRVDLFAWYHGYDENGDGRFGDWHGGWFQPQRNTPAEWQDHVATLKAAPFEATWNTRWVPDQPAGQIQLIARIQGQNSVWFVTDAVDRLTLKRPNETVTLHRVQDFPPDFGVRVGQRKSCVIPLPDDFDPERIVEVGLHYRTWHGWDKHHEPYQLNDLVQAHEGKNHHYHYHIHAIPPGALRPGGNVFTIFSQTDHHMLEILWPGPALLVRQKR